MQWAHVYLAMMQLHDARYVQVHQWLVDSTDPDNNDQIQDDHAKVLVLDPVPDEDKVHLSECANEFSGPNMCTHVPTHETVDRMKATEGITFEKLKLGMRRLPVAGGNDQNSSVAGLMEVFGVV